MDGDLRFAIWDLGGEIVDRSEGKKRGQKHGECTWEETVDLLANGVAEFSHSMIPKIRRPSTVPFLTGCCSWPVA